MTYRLPKLKLPPQVGDWGGQDAIEGQRQAIRDIADAIEAGKPIPDAERGLVAFALRRWADSLPATIKRPPGRPPEYNAVQAAGDFVALRHAGAKHQAALFEVARLHGIRAGDDETLQKKVWDKIKPYIDTR